MICLFCITTDTNWFKKVAFYYHSLTTVKCGVPRGSIGGPLIFIMYINDICHISKLLYFILFANDTTVFYLNSNLDTMHNTINGELKEVCNWFKCNKLSINDLPVLYHN